MKIGWWTGATALRVAALACVLGSAALPGLAQTGAAAPAGASMERLIKGAKTYAEFRKAALAAGWTPVVNAKCSQDVYGRNAPAQGNICQQLTEIESCGSGNCLMRFENKATGEKAAVTTYGDYEGWNVPGREDLAIQGWEPVKSWEAE
jgi:hypothetical protein